MVTGTLLTASGVTSDRTVVPWPIASPGCRQITTAKGRDVTLAAQLGGGQHRSQEPDNRAVRSQTPALSLTRLLPGAPGGIIGCEAIAEAGSRKEAT